MLFPEGLKNANSKRVAITPYEINFPTRSALIGNRQSAIGNQKDARLTASQAVRYSSIPWGRSSAGRAHDWQS